MRILRKFNLTTSRTKEAFENCANRLLVLDPFLQNTILHACPFSALKDWIKPLHPTNVIKAIVLRQDSWSKAGKGRSDLVGCVEFRWLVFTEL